MFKIGCFFFFWRSQVRFVDSGGWDWVGMGR
jgi:hypothetical protein